MTIWHTGLRWTMLAANQERVQ